MNIHDGKLHLSRPLEMMIIISFMFWCVMQIKCFLRFESSKFCCANTDTVLGIGKITNTLVLMCEHRYSAPDLKDHKYISSGV